MLSHIGGSTSSTVMTTLSPGHLPRNHSLEHGHDVRMVVEYSGNLWTALLSQPRLPRTRVTLSGTCGFVATDLRNAQSSPPPWISCPRRMSCFPTPRQPLDYTPSPHRLAAHRPPNRESIAKHHASVLAGFRAMQHTNVRGSERQQVRGCHSCMLAAAPLGTPDQGGPGPVATRWLHSGNSFFCRSPDENRCRFACASLPAGP
jgi:hypothetical protein